MDVERELEWLCEGAPQVIQREELRAKLQKSKENGEPLKVKWGADPSAPDLHLGHAVVLKRLRRFQEAGHVIQFLIGDFTARIGDPTGKSATRKSLSQEEVEENAKTYLDQVFKILDPSKTKVVYNSEWCRPMRFEEVIRLASRYTLARILERDDFTNRLKEGRPISLHELLYPLIQGYDSVVLKSDVELCGTDQIFNCLVARALQQEEGQKPEVILALPLLIGLDGTRKMSKSYQNHIGLTEEPKSMYAKLMSVPDEQMQTYVEWLCDWSKEEKEDWRKGLESGKLHPKEAKTRIAYHVTAFFHGEKEADAARGYFESRYTYETSVDYPEVFLAAGRWRVDELLVEVGAAKTKAQAKRLVLQGAVEWGETKNMKAVQRFTEEWHLKEKSPMLLRCGRNFFKIVPENNDSGNS